MLGQLGTSIGLATTAVVSSSVTAQAGHKDSQSPEALMKGYRAAFWMVFAWMAGACVLGVCGLRKLGRVGEKRD